MTDSLANVVISYSRFLDCQERRRRIASESTPRDRPPAIDAVVPVAAETALPPDAEERTLNVKVAPPVGARRDRAVAALLEVFDRNA